jgi:catechol 2,3-dioxygenase-like lactoylglutathione lyase family enzyme
MNLRISHAFITVEDQDQALAFYRDVIGLEVRQDVPFDNARWLTFGTASQPDLELVALPPDMGHGPDDSKTLSALLAKGALQGVIFRSDDVDAEFDRIVAAGAEVVQEPMDQPYGVRDCAVRDPFGNQIRIGQEPKES